MVLPLVIVGPTASGKSALGLAVAEATGGEIVNADALQVYRGLDLGTAKPDRDERRRVAHHLLDVIEPETSFSAGDFARLARRTLGEIAARGRRAIVVGGSGFYLRALFSGLSPLPPADPELRRELRRRAHQEGAESLWRELARVDPESAARLGPGDLQRVVRALEVEAVTGRKLSQQIAARPLGEQPVAALWVGLTLPRAILYDRIAARVARMLDQGWVAEVEGLLERGVGPDAPAFQAIGYRQIVQYLRGECSLESAVDETVRATRRFAKRQLTWFRREPQVHWLDAQGLLDTGGPVDVSEVLARLESMPGD